MPNLSELQQLLDISDKSFSRDMLAKMLKMMMKLEVSSQNNANKMKGQENVKLIATVQENVSWQVVLAKLNCKY